MYSWKYTRPIFTVQRRCTYKSFSAKTTHDCHGGGAKIRNWQKNITVNSKYFTNNRTFMYTLHAWDKMTKYSLHVVIKIKKKYFYNRLKLVRIMKNTLGTTITMLIRFWKITLNFKHKMTFTVFTIFQTINFQ